MEFEKPVLLKVLTLTRSLRQQGIKQKSRKELVLHVITKPGKNRKFSKAGLKLHRSPTLD
jgi:hypothetical protein